MLKRFESFDKDSLMYYAFDWDDNILNMPTVIYMEKKVGENWVEVEVSTHEFAKIRGDKENYRILGEDPEKAFAEFRDFGSRGDNAFLIDTIKAIADRDFGPSWDKFIECLKGGYLFAIITARGHEPETIRKAVEYIIDNVLSNDDKFLMYNNCLYHAYVFAKDSDFDRIYSGQLSKSKLIKQYLDNCDFFGVTSDYFTSQFGEATASNPEKGKEIALKYFVDKCFKFGISIGKPVKLGFSDDDPKNVDHIYKIFHEELSGVYDAMEFYLFKTTDKYLKGGVKTKFTGGQISEASHQALGMESSVMAFTQFNSMANRLFPSNKHNYQDPIQNTLNLGVDHISKVTKEIVKPKKKVKKIKSKK